MGEVTEKRVLEALRAVKDPDLHRDIVDLGFVKNLKICGGSVSLDIQLTTPACPVKAQMEEQAKQALRSIPGVDSITVNMTSQVTHSKLDRAELLKGVKNIIAVGSGKGGVGKSTASVGIAVALAQEGARVGLFDLDVWGPNIPMMIGAKGPFDVLNRDGKQIFVPPVRYGVKVVSLGFFLQPGQSVNWRGPMVHHYIRQMGADVEWGELDYLVCDLPPGTGDVALSMCQLIPPTGAVIVSTPQDVALDDAQKSIAMFRTLRVPILGMIENMSFFECPHCSKRTEIFSYGGAERAAERLEIPFLGRIPIDVDIRIGGDQGEPILRRRPESAAARLFLEAARNLAARVSVENALKAEEHQMGQPIVWGKPK